MSYTTRTTCRVCGSDQLTPLFSLGVQHVSDFVPADKVTSGPKCPIDIELCRSCSLVQAKHTAPQDFLYTRHYWYRSGVTQTMRDSLRDVAAAVERTVSLKPGDVVLDIGSNDGTLLRSYSVPGIIKVGVEPATNLVGEGRRGVDIFINDFWHYKAFSDAWTETNGLKRAKVVTAIGMAYDLEDPNQFIADVAKVLHPEGVFIAQLMCLKQTLEKRDVGNFAHEHLEFYSLRSLEVLFNRHGLEVFDLEENDVNGGSYRLFVRHRKGPTTPAVATRFNAGLIDEERARLHDPDAYVQFRSEMETNRRRVHAFVSDAVRQGKRVWVYGASTKGNVILQYYGLDHTLIEAAADRSPEKWGKFTAGTGIPIHDEETFRKANPDYALVLPYAFLPEFVERESAWLVQGGKFLVPLPTPRLVSLKEGSWQNSLYTEESL